MLKTIKNMEYGPIKIINDNLILPSRYIEVLKKLIEDEDLGYDIDEMCKNINKNNWKIIRNLLISSVWMDRWIRDGVETITMKTDIFDFSTKYFMKFDSKKFIRLSSLSNKNFLQPLYSINKKFMEEYMDDDRIMSSYKIADSCGRSIKLVVRDFIDLNDYCQWRCFVFNFKIVAISFNDFELPDYSDDYLVNQANILLNNFQPYTKNLLPDFIMDIAISLNKKNYIIELNSYGYWGNAGLELFDWIDDAFILYNDSDYPVIRKN